MLSLSNENDTCANHFEATKQRCNEAKEFEERSPEPMHCTSRDYLIELKDSLEKLIWC